VFKVERRSPEAHRYSVSCVAWYPVDTGLFVTGSFDQDVKVAFRV
jgi:DNA excision repair protein ERCC-8